MSDKVQLIKEEIERLYKHYLDAQEFDSGYNMALDDILKFIDSIPEEPASKDLEEASRNHADNEEYGDDVYYAIKAAFKAGSEWQKQQMMKDAVKGEYWIGEIHLDTPIIQGYNDGDRIKFIPIKHKQQ